MNEFLSLNNRCFIPGSEWVYYKIYTGLKTSDNLLVNIIKPLTENLLERGIIDKWFFIRYCDPQFHLRIRFHLANPVFSHQLVSAFYESVMPLVLNETTWKIQIDTYVREIERYGYSTIDIVENLFYFHSRVIVSFLGTINNDFDETKRWLFGLKFIDHIIDECSFNKEGKIIFVKNHRNNYLLEFNAARNIEITLDKKYRKECKRIRDVLYNQDEFSPFFAETLSLFSKEISIELSKVIDIKNNNQLKTSFDVLVSSIIHMMLNRLFKSKQRTNELVLYYFLDKFLESESARLKYNPAVS